MVVYSVKPLLYSLFLTGVKHVYLFKDPLESVDRS